MRETEGGVVQSVGRAIGVLRALVDGPQTLGVLAERLELPKASAHRILAALVDSGCVSQDPATRRYAMGPAILKFADGFLHGHSGLVLVARPILDHLARATEESVTLQVRMGLERAVVATIPSEQNFRYVQRVGDTVPLHAGAAGRCLLAFLPAAERRVLVNRMPFVRFTENTIVGKTTFERELGKVKVRGYSISEGEHVLGGTSVAAPIFVGKTPVAALTVGGPTLRVNGNMLERYRQMVVREATNLSEVATQVLKVH